jgi:hypothetical protein
MASVKLSYRLLEEVANLKKKNGNENQVDV